MNHKSKIKDVNLCYITDLSGNISIQEQVEAVCKGGAKYVQLRMKDSSESQMLEQAKLAKQICDSYNVLFIINDNVLIAKTVDADGVHLGKQDMSPQEARSILGVDKIIGSTCNTLEDITIVAKQPIDYIGLGPFRYTTTKKNLSPVLGVDGYQNLIDKIRPMGIDLPVFAIGGITSDDIKPIMQTGVNGVAVSCIIRNSPDIEGATKQLLNKLN